ncbi:MAG TPA: hypothetical protein VEX86_21865 [Longimicrobium sp.]|nr:hypothetical protein [Longimicrobium sp.]
MAKRINLLALLVIAAGGAVLARPAPASATYYDPWRTHIESCCTAYDGWGRTVQQCCSNNGCYITKGLCTPLA